jgi:pimeloyl-ACP methyl ester carboxylesterase
MIDRRDVLVGSATALAASMFTSITPVLAQGTTVPGTKRGFLDRPGCRVYYEVTGSGPPIIFAHGLGSNHLTWWQQVPHFSDRYTCVTFAHRGYPPSSEIGVPDPRDFAGDLAALIEHLQLADVRLVAQSMGGWTSIEYLLAHPNHKVRALVLASTCGTIHKPSIPMPAPERLIDWNKKAATARADMASRGISPPAGERMAREQPELHLLYRMIANASAAFDREELRKHLTAMATRPPDVLRSVSIATLFITGGEDTTYPPFLSDALAPLMPSARVEQVPDSGHSVYFQRAGAFNRLVENFLSKDG